MIIMYVTTDTLPAVIRRALADVDYHKRDIEVNRGGAGQITTAGRNALGDYRGY